MLPSGTRIGPYEIVALIGAGGMGEVYRAHDARLKRDVALKLLPEAVAGDGERLARFEREAQALAAISHPGIAAIHGVEQDGGRNALVMELVDGPTLADRLQQGPMAIDEAIDVARQIANALTAAHDAGIIHRDLKPANIKLRPDGAVKLLDFGLAKALESQTGTASGAQLTNSPTITSPAMTHAGVILGTAAYMSPEQARGKRVDKRADVWAFGCVLFEMLTCKVAFGGETVTDVLGAIVRGEPEWGQLPADTPAQIRRLLQRCLEKDPARRLRDVADAFLEIDERPPTPPPALVGHRGPGRGAALAIATLGTAIGVIATWLLIRPAQPPAPAANHAIQFDIAVPSSAVRYQLSPSGRHLAYLGATGQGDIGLWVRDLGDPTPRRLGAAVDVTWLAWTADGNALLTSIAGRQHRVDVQTGLSSAMAGTWAINAVSRAVLPDGRAILGSGTGSLQLDDGKGTIPLWDLDASDQELRQVWPTLASSDSVLYLSERRGGRFLCVAVISSRTRKCLGPINHDSAGWYDDGYVLYSREGTLIARRFDLAAAAFAGDETPIASGVQPTSVQSSGLTASAANSVAFAVGAGTQRLVWMTPGGDEAPILEIPRTNVMTVSPNGTLVLVRVDGQLRVIDLARGGTAQVAGNGGDAIWAPDGRRFAYHSNRGIVTRAIDNPAESVVYGSNDPQPWPEDWSPDGRWIASGLGNPSRAMLVPVAGGEPRFFLDAAGDPTDVDELQFSPDGKWISLNAFSSSRSEVFVVPMPPDGRRWQVSTRGGMQARWHPSGKKIYFFEPDGSLMEVDVTGSRDFVASAPRRLFRVSFPPARNFDDYDVGPDGRFLVKRPATTGTEAIRVIVNWRALLPAPSRPLP